MLAPFMARQTRMGRAERKNGGLRASVECVLPLSSGVDTCIPASASLLAAATSEHWATNPSNVVMRADVRCGPSYRPACLPACSLTGTALASELAAVREVCAVPPAAVPPFCLPRCLPASPSLGANDWQTRWPTNKRLPSTEHCIELEVEHA